MNAGEDSLGSDSLLFHGQQHLIRRSADETPGQPTWGFHDPHGAEPDMLRSQMLYPLSYERWFVAVTCTFRRVRGGA
jgi:hypothetical protein